MRLPERLGHVVRLMATSPVHRDWTIADIERLILPPLARGQFVMTDRAFASWAFFDEDAERRFFQRATRAGDWASGPAIYLVDVIALQPGDARRITSAVRSTLREQGHAGEDIYYRRTYPDRPWRVSRSKL